MSNHVTFGVAVNGNSFFLSHSSFFGSLLYLIQLHVDYHRSFSNLLVLLTFLQNTGHLDDFKRVRTLGAGSFGRVILCQHIGNKQFYAIKVLDKAKVRHIAVLTSTRNPAKASGVRPYETGSRNMAATKKMNFLTLDSYSLFQTLFG